MYASSASQIKVPEGRCESSPNAELGIRAIIASSFQDFELVARSRDGDVGAEFLKAKG